MKKTVLVTGSSGFIGFHLCKKLLIENYKVVGVDNHNNYYSVKLKEDRLRDINLFKKKFKKKFIFHKVDIYKKKNLEKLFAKFKFDYVINLAAQAGVRYSLVNPDSYTKSNLVGFANLLECCRNYKIKHLVYASTSSVYGANIKSPFSEKDNVDHQIQYYAATKRANELMAHSYSCLFNLKTTGLRFFTVYGPWGRPDMALFQFTKNILENKPIKIFNFGKHVRDFTYIDDIIDGILKALKNPKKKSSLKVWKKIKNPSNSFAPFQLLNIGNNTPVPLMKYIEAIENKLNKKSIKKFLPLQKGDVVGTSSNIHQLKKYGYKPKVNIKIGVNNFVDWYLDYHKSKKKRY